MVIPAEGVPRLATTQERSAGTLCRLPPSRKIDEYGAAKAGDEKPRLDLFAATLKSDEEVRGVIVGYGGRADRVGAGQRHADRAKTYIMDRQPLINPRINTIDCGLREQPTIELWIMPVGAAPPLCSPTIEPAVTRVAPRTRRAVSGRRSRRRR